MLRGAGPQYGAIYRRLHPTVESKSPHKGQFMDVEMQILFHSIVSLHMNNRNNIQMYST